MKELTFLTPCIHFSGSWWRMWLNVWMEADSYDRGYNPQPIPALLCSTHVISVPVPCSLQVREPSIKLMRSFITEFQMFHCFVKCGGKGDKIPLWVVKFGHKLLINLVSTKINWDINRYNLHICFDPSRANDVLLSNAEVEEKTWSHKLKSIT